jgi:site-specific DNA recombinase
MSNFLWLPNARLVALIVDARRWVDDLAEVRAPSVRDFAPRNGSDVGEIGGTLPLAFLAPDIVEAILAGRQPIALTPRQLSRIGTLPCRWVDQRIQFGFRA